MKRALHIIGHVLFVVIRFIIRDLMLRFDRKVLKRYLNIKTPLYKLWWSCHTSAMQLKLNKYYKSQSKAA